MEITGAVVVIGVVGTIVGPRMSRGASSSPFVGDQVLVGHLRLLRGAIASYAAEHAGHFPAGDAANVTAQLTGFSDILGHVSARKTTRYDLGPYLGQIPALPVGVRQGGGTLGLASSPGEAGWVYDSVSGAIHANADDHESDAMGRPYASY
jgi:hypothetical protein